MHYLTSLLPMPAFGMAILMGGILMTRAPKENLRSAFIESLFWGMGLFLCFSTEILIFENL